MVLESFHPVVRDWFVERFGDATEPQRVGWPSIQADRNTLIAAPTGSGKTLAAFLVCIDRMVRQWLAGELPDTTQVVYISPLKALSNDIERNLQGPLQEIADRLRAAGHGDFPLRIAVRTGDTGAASRSRMAKTPPHILVTTPESLYLLLTSKKSRNNLQTVRSVIVDEIHALARDKRGSHLTLTLERLAHFCHQPPQRIGLSATQRPIEDLAWFLVGQRPDPADPARADCTIVDGGHVREMDLAIEVPPRELSAVCSGEQWDEIYTRLVDQIQSHRSTLVFVNTRRMAERISHRLGERLGTDAVASHHGSLSKELRLLAEQRLKAGELRAIVATASLEMGIDIGYIDLVCQIGSPRSIAGFLQRVGRAGHSLHAIPKGRLFPLTRDELLESMALIRAVRERELDRIEIPQTPLDILAQQVVAAVACEDWDERQLLETFRRAWPFRNLTDAEYTSIVEMLSRGITPSIRRGAYLHRDQIHGQLRARKSARLAAIMSGGAIPEQAEFRVVTEQDRTYVGSVDEDFAIDSSAGNVFVLGNNSWRIRHIRGGEVVVNDAHGAAATIPFWFGESPGRTIELSEAVSRLRREIADRCPLEIESTKPRSIEPANPARDANADDWFADEHPAARSDCEAIDSMTLDTCGTAPAWLRDTCGVNDWAGTQAVRYVQAQVAAVGMVPTTRQILFERFFDESGGMQLVIHAPLGARINRAWGLALRKRFCRSFDFELQAAATDNGIVLSLSPQHSFPIEQLFKMLGTHNGEHLLQQAVLAVPMFQVRWRWNVTRALAVLRNQGGKRVPFFLQRFRSDDLLAAAFPETVGCLENHHGDVEIPDHPLVQQTMRDCLEEAMDAPRWIGVLDAVQNGRIEFVPRDTREPSPFSHELLNASPYAFLDGAGLEERRTRAVSTRRTLSPDDFRDLTRLDADAIRQVTQDAWPTVRSAEELHDALLQMIVVRDDELGEWREWLPSLIDQQRAIRIDCAAGPAFWSAAEHGPLVRVLYPESTISPSPDRVPPPREELTASQAWVELLRGRMPHSGPTSAEELAAKLSLQTASVFASLEALEGQGVVMRGQFTHTGRGQVSDDQESRNAPLEWCDRRLLARIHRLTIDGLRRRIQAVTVTDYLRFLAHHHQLLEVTRTGPLGVQDAVQQLEGFEAPAGAWEYPLLASRVKDYDPSWLDQLFLSGELVWGRLCPPRRSEEDSPSRAPLTRAMPMALVRREDLAWLLPPDRVSLDAHCRGNARTTLDALSQRGALFLSELKTLTKLLPSHLEESIRELAALGLITADAFAAVRSLTGAVGPNRRRLGAATVAVGRWSRFPGIDLAPTAEPDPRQRDSEIESWCRLLLRRYGVVFRDLLARESAAPPWGELVRFYRRMELRGEIRGGRFVAGVGGEQYAEEKTVARLREIRENTAEDPWIVISAADPLNLRGILDQGPRIPAVHRHAIVMQNGKYIAFAKQRDVEFFSEVPPEVENEMRRALQMGFRRSLAQSAQLTRPAAMPRRVLNATPARSDRAATRKPDPSRPPRPPR